MISKKQIAFIVLGVIIGIMLFELTGSRTLAPAPKPEGTPRDFSGFVRNVKDEGSRVVLVIDDAEFLSGEVAIVKGMEDTGCPRERISDCIPSLNNDFYIRNRDASTQEFVIGDGADIRILINPGSPILGQNTIAEFVENYRNPDMLMRQLPFNFTAQGNVLTRIEGQYTP